MVLYVFCRSVVALRSDNRPTGDAKSVVSRNTYIEALALHEGFAALRENAMSSSLH
jgi:hypothetical protein